MFEPEITLETRLSFILGINSAVARRIIERRTTIDDLSTAQQNSHLAFETLLKLFLEPETAIQFRLNPNLLTAGQLQQLPQLDPQLIPIVRASRPFFSLEELAQATQLPQTLLREFFELPSYLWCDRPKQQMTAVTPVAGIYTAITAASDFESVSLENVGYSLTTVSTPSQQITIIRTDDFEADRPNSQLLKQNLKGRICPALLDGEGCIRYLIPLAIDLWFESDVSRDRLEAILAELQLQIAADHPEALIEMGYVRAVIPGCPVDTDPLRAILSIVRQVDDYQEIRFAEPEQIGIDDFGLDTTQLAETSTDFEASGRDWNLQAINLPAAHQITQGSNRVTIFAIDGGVETAHPSISSALRQDWRSVDLDFTLNNPQSAISPNELDIPHGTQVASVAVAQASSEQFAVARGVAPNCRVLPLKISGFLGYGLRAAAIRQAIALLKPNERGIINLSWRINGDHIGIREALIEADRQGLAIVTSAGNYSFGREQRPNELHYPSAYRYKHPYLKSLCSVAAANAVGKRAVYSYFGNRSITVAAPGGERGQAGQAIYVASPIGQYAYVWGTSFAAPHVAGSIGLMLALDPQLKSSEAIAILEQTAQSVTESEGLGRGIIDANAALLAVQNAIQDGAVSAPPDPEPQTNIDHLDRGKVNLNTASPAELATLPLMNEWRIQHLVDYRAKNRPLESVWDLIETEAFELWVIRELRELVTV